jgi:pSer/pThr/pTyr-binding forkhead associated (FHA) protein
VRPQDSGARRRTVFGHSGAIEQDHAFETVKSAPAPGPVRKAVALLVTYTWRPEGQVMLLREGRNYIGSDPECEIFLPDDPQISGKHATIVYRGTDFWIDDEKSMNGTFVDGDCVEEKRRLPNYARITTGGTVWTFIMIEPPGA